MNEIALHRGSSPHLNTIDIFVDGQHLTEAVVCEICNWSFTISKQVIVRWPHRLNPDGINSLLSVRRRPYRAPFTQCVGSYPHLPSKSVIPATRVSRFICHHSTSMSPSCNSNSATDRVTRQIGDRSRSSAGVSMDGRVSHILNPGEYVNVQASPYPVPCINRSSMVDPDHQDEQHEGAGPGKDDDWVRDINNLLQYNATFRSKALLRHSRTWLHSWAQAGLHESSDLWKTRLAACMTI